MSEDPEIISHASQILKESIKLKDSPDLRAELDKNPNFRGEAIPILRDFERIWLRLERCCAAQAAVCEAFSEEDKESVILFLLRAAEILKWKKFSKSNLLNLLQIRAWRDAMPQGTKIRIVQFLKPHEREEKPAQMIAMLLSEDSGMTEALAVMDANPRESSTEGSSSPVEASPTSTIPRPTFLETEPATSPETAVAMESLDCNLGGEWTGGTISLEGRNIRFDGDEGNPQHIFLNPTLPHKFSMLPAEGFGDSAELCFEGDMFGKLRWSNGSVWSRAKLLCVDVMQVRNIKDSAWRFGDVTRRSVGKEVLSLVGRDVTFQPYVKVSSCGSSRRSQAVHTKPSGETRCADFSEQLILRIPQDICVEGVVRLKIEVFDSRGLTATLRGDPLIGAAELNLNPESNGQPEELPLLRDGTEKGSLILSASLLM
jgi:hypothetical protein